MTILATDNGMTVEIEDEIIEPAFLRMDALSSQKIAIDLSDYFSHQITRNPTNLRSHTQRIFYFIENRKSLELYSALVDLFFILGDKGAALRKRMLISAYSLLSEHERESLKQCLASNFKSISNLAFAPKSLLTNGVNVAMSPFILKVETAEKRKTNPADEARDYLENGQLDEAISTLQNAILLNPRHLTLHNDLLEIFQRMRDKKVFSSFYEILLERKVSLPFRWRELALELENENIL